MSTTTIAVCLCIDQYNMTSQRELHAIECYRAW